MKNPIKSTRVTNRLLALAGVTFALLWGNHSAASVITWGDNTYGQSSTNVPAGMVGAKAITAGYWHNLAVTASGKVVAWGLSDYGQTNVPSTLSNVVAVAAGRDHSVALKQNGGVVAWGDNTYGQTNMPPDLTNATAISAGGFHTAALRADGTVTCWGYDFYQQTNVPASVTNAVAVACGNAFSLALLTNGTIIGWGDDYYGQTDIPADLTNAVAIAAGGFHGVAIRADGTIKCWGYDAFGQTEVPGDVTNVLMVAGGYYHSLALRSDGVVKQWGDTSLGQTNPPSGLTRVLGLAGGYAHSLALKDDKPLITGQPQDVVTNAGKTVILSAVAAGATPLAGRWWQVKGGVTNSVGSMLSSNVSPATFKLTVSNVGTNNAGGYFAVVSNSVGTVTSRVATVSLLYPPAITNQPQSTTTNVGATVFLTAGASGTEPLSYQWQLNGANLAGVNATNVLELDNVTTNDAGSYRVIVTNLYGSATSQVAVLVIGGSPLILTPPQSQSVVQGGNATFSILAGGTDPLSYQWWFNGTNLLVAATNTAFTVVSAQATNAGSYSVVVTNLFGGATSSVATLTVLLAPSLVTQPLDVVTNAGGTVSLSVVAMGATPLAGRWWQVKGGVTNSVGSMLSSNVSPATFKLMLSNVGTNSAGGYFAVVSNSVGTVTSSVATVSVLYPPAITNQPQSTAANVGATVFLTVGASGTEPLSYQWQLNGANLAGVSSTNVLELDNVTTNDAGSYRVIVTNLFGSATSQVAMLVIGGSPVIITPPQSQSVVQGGNATFSILAGGTDPMSYQWWFNKTNLLTDATNSAFTVVSAQATNAGNYSVVVTNLFGGATSSVATLTVLLAPSVVVQPQDVVTNAGKTVTLSVVAAGATPLVGRWWQMKGGGNNSIVSMISSNASPATFRLTLSNVGTNNAGGYFVVVSNFVGSVTSSVATVSVLYPPAITNQPQSTAANVGATVFLTVGASGTEPLSYQWQLNGANLAGVGATNVLELDNVTTNDAGSYRVIVTNLFGSATSQVATLIVGWQALTPPELWLLAHSDVMEDSLWVALEAGKNYRIQASTNLAIWSDVTNFLSSSDLMVFTNRMATNVNQMFYRVVSP